MLRPRVERNVPNLPQPDQRLQATPETQGPGDPTVMFRPAARGNEPRTSRRRCLSEERRRNCSSDATGRTLPCIPSLGGGRNGLTPIRGLKASPPAGHRARAKRLSKTFERRGFRRQGYSGTVRLGSQPRLLQVNDFCADPAFRGPRLVLCVESFAAGRSRPDRRQLSGQSRNAQGVSSG